MAKPDTLVHSTEFWKVRRILTSSGLLVPPTDVVFLRAGKLAAVQRCCKTFRSSGVRPAAQIPLVRAAFRQDDPEGLLQNNDLMDRVKKLQQLHLPEKLPVCQTRISRFLADCYGNSPALFGLSRYGPVNFLSNLKDVWEAYLGARRKGGARLTRKDVFYADAGWMTFSRERQRIVFLMAKYVYQHSLVMVCIAVQLSTILQSSLHAFVTQVPHATLVSQMQLTRTCWLAEVMTPSPVWSS